MAQSTSTDKHLDGLRQRNVPVQATSAAEAKAAVQGLNAEQMMSKDQSEQPRTFGRTPGGIVFTVPQTHDMVSQLLSPTQPKNIGDLVVVAILGFHILLLFILPEQLRIPVIAAVFVFWRLAYNVGIGYLLHIQSNHKRLVTWARKLRLFDNPKTGNQPRPKLYAFLKREFETKIPKDYSFDQAPIEYNTWLLFRRFVDLILMCDFVTYCTFATACGATPPGESIAMTAFRWIVGWVLIGFNLWVKLDAHRVVKDFAWYWGDFFYLIDQELTFDGVFEMAPHPMYSVGYVGFYGISLLAASYYVLFISIFAHLAQFVFLAWVESPHIDKTYNPPPKRERHKDSNAESDSDSPTSATPVSPIAMSPMPRRESQGFVLPTEPSGVHQLLGLHNLDLTRVTDSAAIVIVFHLSVLTLATPNSSLWQTLFVINAFLWRSWYSIGLGYILNRQSNKKMWTRHFLKFGETTDEAWRQWKGTYHLSLIMTYASFIAAVYKSYSLPSEWTTGYILLKHVAGIALIALHSWTSLSIYEQLGEFGWFFGDFFYDNPKQLNYGGIYRFLNNPERLLGLAGLWGAVLITSSPAIFLIAAWSHVLSLAFIQFIERPHMQKMYGRSLRSDSGFVKSIKRSFPTGVEYWQSSVDKMLGGTVDFIEEFIEGARPRVAAGVHTIVEDSTSLFTHPSRITITRIEPDMAGYDPKDYSLEIVPPSSEDRATAPSGTNDRLSFRYGAPIRLKWTAPLNHSQYDWIGLYRVAELDSRNVTRISSAGRWIATNKDQFDWTTADDGCLTSDQRVSGRKRQDGETKDFLSGTMEFSGDKLFWTTGVFEFRYHHNGKHNTMVISRPFEIRINRFDEEDVEMNENGMMRGAVEQALLHTVRDCLDRDPEIAPADFNEKYGSVVSRDGKYARRIAFAVTRMFGIDFAPEVVLADGNVRNLSWRICNAKQVLAPFNMSSSQGRTTPADVKYQEE